MPAPGPTGRNPRSDDGDRPQHPTWPTVWLLLGTTLVIVLLALASSYGRL